MSDTPISWTPQTESGEPAQNALAPQAILDLQADVAAVTITADNAIPGAERFVIPAVDGYLPGFAIRDANGKYLYISQDASANAAGPVLVWSLPVDIYSGSGLTLSPYGAVANSINLEDNFAILLEDASALLLEA